MNQLSLYSDKTGLPLIKTICFSKVGEDLISDLSILLSLKDRTNKTRHKGGVKLVEETRETPVSKAWVCAPG